jgi:hypothetical protein
MGYNLGTLVGIAWGQTRHAGFGPENLATIYHRWSASGCLEQGRFGELGILGGKLACGRIEPHVLMNYDSVYFLL